MKHRLLRNVMLLSIFALPNFTFAQTADLRSLAGFILFTSAGAVGNTGISQISGNIGSHVGAITGFEAPTVVNGTIYNSDGVTAQCIADLEAVYSQLNAVAATNIMHAPAFGSGETILPGVYSIAGAGSLNGNLILDAEGNPDAVFIFRYAGAFTSGASSTVILSNGASACNVFWVAEGAVALAALTTMKGILIAHPGAASMGAGCTLEGRMFSTAGAVSVYGLTALMPNGCASTTALWTGNAGTTDWFTLNNWQGGVPGLTKNVTIPGTPAGGAVYPVIDTGTARVDILNVEVGATLTVTSTLQVNGSINNSGIFNVSDGTLELSGSAPQNISNTTFTNNTVKNLVLSNNVSLFAEDTITGSLSFGNVNDKTFNTGTYLTLKSTATRTASVADITNTGRNSGNNISGNVKVERHIPAGRGWRMLTSPTGSAGAQTINSAWQEGVDPLEDIAAGIISNPFPGFGTHITGGTALNGFDQGINLNPGIKKFQNGAWVGLGSTYVTVNSEPGFMLFVRGDKSIAFLQGINAMANNTVLRSSGTLKSGDQSFVNTRTGFSLIGNPYASRINFKSIDKGNAADVYYLWDPKLTGTNQVGGFVTFTRNGNTYSASPIPAGNFDLNGGIESGSAFFIDATAGNTITIRETDKDSGSTNVFRTPGTSEQLRANLYASNADGTESLQDGILFLFNTGYSNSVDKSDARKMMNLSENLGIGNDSAMLSIEKRQPLSSADTLVLNISAMKIKNYHLEFISTLPGTNGLTGFLEDSYLNTSTIFNLNDTTLFDFSIADNPESWDRGRFRIVFKQLNTLPLTFCTLKASRQRDEIIINWNMNSEKNINHYEIQASKDGLLFQEKDQLIALGKNESNYFWSDKKAQTGNNFYRIKVISCNGSQQYSNVVNVNLEKAADIIIYPNPVTGNIVHLTFNNMATGVYQVKLINSTGQVVIAGELLHAWENTSENFQLPVNLGKGMYHLNFITPVNTCKTIKLFN